MQEVALTKEMKELLRHDLCSRLPYEVKAQFWGVEEEQFCYDTVDSIFISGESDEVLIGQYAVGIKDIKPYLFPLSSMTEEQYKSFIIASGWDVDYEDIKSGKFSCIGYVGPGLVIDVYGDTAVIQAHSVGMHYAKDVIAELLVEIIPAVQNVYYKSEGTMPFKAPVKPVDGYLIGNKTETIALENGLKFHANWLDGQKTGFFVDQRDNRSLLEHYARGRNVLNMFCYTGGFSFYAMRGGANLVHSVDSSAKAIELTNKNIELNFPGDPRHEAYAVDAFKYLDDIKDKYDLIILDPPAFAKHRDALRNALRGYTRLNALAFEQIRPGGILFTFSCSQAVSKEQFRLAVFTAAAQSGRSVRILHQLTQPIDHPVNIYHPEGEYLKGLVLYVE